MKRKRPRNTVSAKPILANWIDTDELVKPGEMKEIAPNMWVVRTGEVLDPAEPIKKQPKSKRKPA